MVFGVLLLRAPTEEGLFTSGMRMTHQEGLSVVIPTQTM